MSSRTYSIRTLSYYPSNLFFSHHNNKGHVTFLIGFLYFRPIWYLYFILKKVIGWLKLVDNLLLKRQLWSLLVVYSVFSLIYDIDKMFYYIFQAFIASDITFAMKPYFRGTFCTQGVREGLVVGYLRHVNSVCQVTRLTHISHMSFLRDIGKQSRPRLDATKCSVRSGSPLFAYSMFF